jgi:hypothetical protein
MYFLPILLHKAFAHPLHMNIIQTNCIEKFVDIITEPSHLDGLKHRVSVKENPDHYNYLHTPWYPHIRSTDNYISLNNEYILTTFLSEAMSLKDTLNILELGVEYETSNKSTDILLKNKRVGDIYLGSDIHSKDHLNDIKKNIHTIQTNPENINLTFDKLDALTMDTLDMIVINSCNSIDSAHSAWEYTYRLAKNGIVIIHNTNAHPGPYFLLQCIDPRAYYIFKYFSDTNERGISVIIKK